MMLYELDDIEKQALLGGDKTMGTAAQRTSYPKGVQVEAVREIPLSSPSQGYHADPLPCGTRGIVTGHTDDGRAWVNFLGCGNDGIGHTFDAPERYIRVVMSHCEECQGAPHAPWCSQYVELATKCCEQCDYSDEQEKQQERCLECGHQNSVDLRGRCQETQRDPGGSIIYCGHKCVFPDPSQHEKETRAKENLLNHLLSPRREQIDRAIEVTNEEVLAGVFAPADFDDAWDLTPSSADPKRFTEREHAEYWCLMGERIGIAKSLRAHAADLKEVARERLK